MRKQLKPKDRLIVAADFETPIQALRINWVRRNVLELASELNGTGICLKVNDALMACGCDLVYGIRNYGLRVFADLKLFDIGATLSRYSGLLSEVSPDFLTVACMTGIDGMRALKAKLPNTEVLGVTVLSSLGEAECYEIFGCRVDVAVTKLADMGETAGLDGFVCSPREAAILRPRIADFRTIITPGVRSKSVIIPGDDQNPGRIMTPAEAIKAGADYIVVGRQIIQAENPYNAAMGILDEIASAIT